MNYGSGGVTTEQPVPGRRWAPPQCLLDGVYPPAPPTILQIELGEIQMQLK